MVVIIRVEAKELISGESIHVEVTLENSFLKSVWPCLLLGKFSFGWFDSSNALGTLVRELLAILLGTHKPTEAS